VFFNKTTDYKSGVGRKINRRGKALKIGHYNGKRWKYYLMFYQTEKQLFDLSKPVKVSAGGIEFQESQYYFIS